MRLKYKTVNKMVVALSVSTIILASGIVFYLLALRLGAVAKENQTYNRYISCVLSVPAHDRTQRKIDRCWFEVQKDTGVHVKRYDKEL